MSSGPVGGQSRVGEGQKAGSTATAFCLAFCAFYVQGGWLLRQQLPGVVSPLLMGVVVLVIVLSVFVWAWAVRRPAAAPDEAGGGGDDPAAGDPITYAAIGASDVVGVGAEDPAGESWVNVLHGKLPPGSRLVRLGRSGITLREANTVEVPQAITARPDLVTLWNCVIDATGGVTLTSYIEDLHAALERLTSETEARVMLLNLPDISLLSHAGSEQQELIRGGVMQWNAAMAEAAATHGDRVLVVDLFPVSAEVLDHPEYLSPDHFHPSTKGYRRLAAVVWEEAKRA
ncbi:MAG: GDSL-type esterase/lipase family protein [Chloroflexia bacterium]